MNKLKITVLLPLFLIFFSSLFSQNLQLELIESKQEKTSSLETKMAWLIGETDKGIYTLRTKKKFSGKVELFVARYDDKLNLIAQKPLQFKGQFESIFLLNDELILLSLSY